jgi:hypothetical protein
VALGRRRGRAVLPSDLLRHRRVRPLDRVGRDAAQCAGRQRFHAVRLRRGRRYGDADRRALCQGLRAVELRAVPAAPHLRRPQRRPSPVDGRRRRLPARNPPARRQAQRDAGGRGRQHSRGQSRRNRRRRSGSCS